MCCPCALPRWWHGFDYIVGFALFKVMRINAIVGMVSGILRDVGGIVGVPLYGWYHANWYCVAGIKQSCADYVVRITLCNLHCRDLIIVWIALCRLHRAVCIAQIAVKSHPANCPVGSHCTDCHGIALRGLPWDRIVWIASWNCIVRIASCGWHRADGIVWIASCGLPRGIALCGLHHADGIVWIASRDCIVRISSCGKLHCGIAWCELASCELHRGVALHHRIASCCIVGSHRADCIVGFIILHRETVW